MGVYKQKIIIDGQEHPEIIFLRVSPDNLQDAILLVLKELADFSWLKKLDDATLQESLSLAASNTVADIESKICDENGDYEARKVGQFLVSHLAKKAIVAELQHEDIPLLELLDRRISGSSGFDFYTEKLSENLIVCGEAKFVHNDNPYNDSLKQIKEFIEKRKHILDIQLIVHFTSLTGREKMSRDEHGVCAAFSTTQISTEQLIAGIKRNEALSKLFDRKLIILVGVDIICP
ncbi:MAG: hypothetical protein FWE13_03770 [Firmicutes bacterium]|nr:hypothetical protein [Bacillota bacterium]